MRVGFEPTPRRNRYIAHEWYILKDIECPGPQSGALDRPAISPVWRRVRTKLVESLYQVDRPIHGRQIIEHHLIFKSNPRRNLVRPGANDYGVPPLRSSQVTVPTRSTRFRKDDQIVDGKPVSLQ
jgi:hypothetical protein